VLELDYPTSICLHICDVLFTGFCLVDNLLPVDRKLSFPNAVPFRFLLPPRVAEAASLVSPMPNPDFSALGNHRVIANRTLAQKIGLSFLALSVDECEFHILVMTVFTLAGFQYFGAALEGTPRRPLALGFSALCTPAQSTAVLPRRGRINSGSQ